LQSLTGYLRPVARVVVPVLGLMMCLLAYMMTLKSSYAHKVIPAYILIVLGFLSILVGFYWNICHSMMSKLYHRGGFFSCLFLCRPSFFPPSYEECQGIQVSSDHASELLLTVEAVDVGMNLAPPLYTQSSSEDPDCMWSWERPPQYSQVEHVGTTAEGAPSRL
uniref:Uncharacterized protein n=1 Tax=Salarias fasciatus TaxID=181472 RepID=A0A672JD88_SALFA